MNPRRFHNEQFSIRNPNPVVGPSTIETDTFLMDGSAVALNVNGATTPVVFKFEPPTTNDVAVLLIGFVAEDATITLGGAKFISQTVATLTNGLLVELKAGDRVYQLGNFKNTRDLTLFASQDGFQLIEGPRDSLRATRRLPERAVLKRTGIYATPDYVKVTVRDNLSGLSHLRAYIQSVTP